MVRENIQKIGELVKKNTGSIIKSMGGDFDERKGEFRKNTVYAGNRTFANYQKVPGLIDDLVDYINENIKLVKTPSEINKLSYEAHYQMITIHPFSDGNGRSSRVLMNYIQHYHGLPLTRVFSEDKSEYILALEMTRKKEDIKHFLSFMDFQTKKNLSLEIEKFKQGEKEIKQRNNKGKRFSFLF